MSPFNQYIKRCAAKLTVCLKTVTSHLDKRHKIYIRFTLARNVLNDNCKGMSTWRKAMNTRARSIMSLTQGSMLLTNQCPIFTYLIGEALVAPTRCIGFHIIRKGTRPGSNPMQMTEWMNQVFQYILHRRIKIAFTVYKPPPPEKQTKKTNKKYTTSIVLYKNVVVI